MLLAGAQRRSLVKSCVESVEPSWKLRSRAHGVKLLLEGVMVK